MIAILKTMLPVGQFQNSADADEIDQRYIDHLGTSGEHSENRYEQQGPGADHIDRIFSGLLLPRRPDHKNFWHPVGRNLARHAPSSFFR